MYRAFFSSDDSLLKLSGAVSLWLLGWMLYNLVASSKILVAMVTKIVATWRSILVLRNRIMFL